MPVNKYNPQNASAPCDAGREDRDPFDDRPDLTADQRTQARFLVCANSEDAADAAELMLMLGIFPGQEEVSFSIDANYIRYTPFGLTR